MQLKHIIFDCDGVLVDSEIVAAQVMVPVLTTLGHAITVNHYLAHYTGKTFRHIFSQFDIDQRVDVDMLIKNVEEKVYQNIKAVEGITDVLEKLDHNKSVVSNSAMHQITAALAAIGHTDTFINRFSASQVANPKPAPDVYEFAMRHIDEDKAHVLVIEDSISGCTAALAAGLNVVGFCGGKHIMPDHAQKLRNVGVQQIASSSVELLSIINKLKKNELAFTSS